MSDVEQMLMDQEGSGPYRDDRFYPYIDSVGKSTIAWGHNLDDKGIKADVAMMLFRQDIADAMEAVRFNFSCYDTVSRARQLVLISMGFNLGKAGLAKFVRFIGAVHQGDWEEAAAQIENSKAALQAPARYKTLARMMRENISEWV